MVVLLNEVLHVPFALYMIDDDYYVDGVYPNEKGQELMAEAAIKVWGN